MSRGEPTREEDVAILTSQQIADTLCDLHPDEVNARDYQGFTDLINLEYIEVKDSTLVRLENIVERFGGDNALARRYHDALYDLRDNELSDLRRVADGYIRALTSPGQNLADDGQLRTLIQDPDFNLTQPEKDQVLEFGIKLISEAQREGQDEDTPVDVREGTGGCVIWINRNWWNARDPEVRAKVYSLDFTTQREIVDYLESMIEDGS